MCSMASKITRIVLDAQVHCHLKAYFRLCGEEGIKSDFETLLLDALQEARAKAIGKILGHYADGEVEMDIPLSRTTLSKGIPFILHGQIQDNRQAIRFDGLKKVDGATIVGEFHYEPVMFSESRRVLKAERQLLAMFAIILSRIQGRVPSSGVLYLGRDCSLTTIRFGATLRAAEDLIRDVERMQRAEKPPKLLLNDHCRICEFRERCHAQAVKEDNLSLLRGLGEKTIKRYARKGLLTLTQLAHTFRPRRRGKRSDRPIRLRDHALHALAIRDKTIYVLGKPEVPTAPVRIYVDIEGNPDEGFIYLIGVIICDGERVEQHSFWADAQDKEATIFDQFLGIVSHYDAPRIYCYGVYEKTFFTRMRRHARRKKHVDAVLAALTNVLTIIFSHFYFPTCSNGLKDVSGCLGFHWSDPAASGIQSIVWRIRWENTRDECWKSKLIQYNSEDCVALRRVTEFLSDAVVGGATRQSAAIPRIASVTELDKLAQTVTWAKFADEDFDFVNKRAYFDYQRSRVFVRTSAALRRHDRSVSHNRTWKNRKIRATHRIDITASKCPHCQSKHLIPIPVGKRPKGVQTRCKRAYDIIVTAGAVKRKVIDFRAVAYRCSQCGHCFVSDRYLRLAKHFHGFMSWFVYQQVTHRLGMKTLAEIFHETFGVRVNYRWEIEVFRDLLARYYRGAYRRLLERIIAGAVLHADETEMKLHDGTGYVWVFANLDTAVYIFRPSREGEFLREMLKDFTGVLVSDFYSAYDGLNCLQQRCLIHLIRDMNQAILDNPFDQELRSITAPFGALLRSIVKTIDEHGLKQRHLEQHTSAVATFFEGLTDNVCESDASKALQVRMLKSRDRLFTFLHHDGVPWNNNVAENAIKQFSRYREYVGRNVKAAGLTEHLVLLSLYQTCRIRGLSFLRFLLSRERDIDAFSSSKRPRRRTPLVQLYPKGYLPPSLVSLRQGKVMNARDKSGIEHAFGDQAD
jgi:predicted RecB family nuclease